MFSDVFNDVQLVYSFSSDVSQHLAFKVGGLWGSFFFG